MILDHEAKINNQSINHLIRGLNLSDMVSVKDVNVYGHFCKLNGPNNPKGNEAK